MEQAYDPKKAKQLALDVLSDKPLAEDQLKAITEMPTEDFRQLMMAVLLEDI